MNINMEGRGTAQNVLVSNEKNKKSGNISTSFGCTKLKFWISSRHNSGCTSC